MKIQELKKVAKLEETYKGIDIFIHKDDNEYWGYFMVVDRPFSLGGEDKDYLIKMAKKTIDIIIN